MKKKLMSLACVAAIGLGIAGVTASADEIEATSGSYKYEANSFSVEPRAEVTENVGGGTWKHNSWVDSSLMKHCTSKYYHAKNKHSSTAVVGPSKDKDINKAGVYTSASAKAKYGWSAYAYWDNDAK